MTLDCLEEMKGAALWRQNLHAKQKIFFNAFHVRETHSLGQDLECFWKSASQLIKYVHTDPITDFRILVIPEAIELSNLVLLEH